MTDIFYDSIIKSKTQKDIPQINNRALHSIYAPEKEALNITKDFNENELFFIIKGIAGAFHIIELLNQNPHRVMILCEANTKNLDFVKKLPQIKPLLENDNIIFTDPENLETKLIEFYLPQLYGNINICTLRSWENFYKDESLQIQESITKAIKVVGADFSVQREFGNLWNRNINLNLKLSEKFDCTNIIKNFDKSKKAAIIAAGPSLDESIKKLTEHRKEYFIISTDTAYSTLKKFNIFCNCVVSIDAQYLSSKHFMGNHNENTVFIFDLCANPSAVRQVLKYNCPVIFCKSGHPLTALTDFNEDKHYFPEIFSGTGTVTIAAVDFARKAGFSEIEFFGADFSYLKGKPYTKGSYLDELYSQKASRLNSIEKQFSFLMYRTETIRLTENSFTTPVLNSYKNSLNEYLSSKADKVYKDFDKFSYENYKNKLNKLLKNINPENLYQNKKENLSPVLPLMAFEEKKLNCQESLKVAYYKTLRYTL